ncbi:NADH-quinone oxidoreductase subunit A [Candidatus Johnevansia muelleri]|uniref:NADH-quinone oxidoreductase subunit A n=1 Tax=Candidatus Johnevansia muelleri TaxID=1495769 RepID=A0A078KED1_9GAMM|nr:NADH-quinone oxidoreductase subunit A [Candidatus Evansia muelleri]
MILQYYGIFFFILVTIILLILIISISSLLGGISVGYQKNIPFESGILETGNARIRFPIKYYLVGIIFVIFDIETIYLLNWSISVRELGWQGFWCATIYIIILLIGLYYDINLGILNWNSEKKFK